MKSIITLATAMLATLLTTSAFAECTTIQDGTLLKSDGNIITTGFDDWGYNYQAHMFNGGYCEAYRDADWCLPYADVDLIMKWNEAWLSNMDCDVDGKLDRHYGLPSYIGSGAWITNHQSGKVDVNGKMRKWTYFVKIVAAPSDAYLSGGFWYTADNIEIGPEIWNEFAVIEEVSNDPSSGEHGVQYISPFTPGFGSFKE